MGLNCFIKQNITLCENFIIVWSMGVQNMSDMMCHDSFVLHRCLTVVAFIQGFTLGFILQVVI